MRDPKTCNWLPCGETAMSGAPAPAISAACAFNSVNAPPRAMLKRLTTPLGVAVVNTDGSSDGGELVALSWTSDRPVPTEHCRCQRT